MLRFLTAGESHGLGLIAILEGMPAGVPSVATPSTNSSSGARAATDAADA